MLHGGGPRSVSDVRVMLYFIFYFVVSFTLLHCVVYHIVNKIFF